MTADFVCLYTVGAAAGLQSPDLTSSARASQPASRSSPHHAQSHAQSVRVPGGVPQNAEDTDLGWLTTLPCIAVFSKCQS